jgi:hypothetical protein
VSKLKTVLLIIGLGFILGYVSPAISQNKLLEDTRFIKLPSALGLTSSELKNKIGPPQVAAPKGCEVKVSNEGTGTSITIQGHLWVYQHATPNQAVRLSLCLHQDVAIAEERALHFQGTKQITTSTIETVDVEGIRRLIEDKVPEKFKTLEPDKTI